MYVECARNLGQAFVGCPQRQRRQNRRGQQVHIDPTQSQTHEATGLDEREDLVVIRYRGRWERTDELEDFGALREITAGKLADDERVGPNRSAFQQLRESRISLP